MISEKILITGASGFLGNHILKYNQIYNVINKSNLFLLTSKKIPYHNCILHKNYSYNKSELKSIGKIDTLIHLASFCPKVRADINNINENIKTITTSQYLLNHLPNIPKKIIYISSISVYGSKLINYPKYINELTNISPDFLYGFSKAICEKVLIEFCRNFNIKLNILRIGVSYGINDDLRQGTIPTIIKSILSNKNIKVYNKGKELKHFIHTDDISRIILKASTTNIADNVINLVDKKAIKIIDLINIIEGFCNKKANIEYLDRIPCNDTLFDNRLMINNFGELKIPLEVGLKDVCEYYKHTNIL